MNSSSGRERKFQASCRCRVSERDLYCTSTKTRRSPLLMQFESVKSMMRYEPPNGTAGFARCSVSGESRSPRPPARTIVSASLGRLPAIISASARVGAVVDLLEDVVRGLERGERLGVDLPRAELRREPVEALYVRAEALHGVRDHGRVRDDERPVARLREEELARRLVQRPTLEPRRGRKRRREAHHLRLA